MKKKLQPLRKSEACKELGFYQIANQGVIHALK